MSNTNRPLWQVMHDADIIVKKETGPIASRRGYAAELRAIAEWLYKQGSLADVVAGANMIKLLYAEADRAEAGEQ
jgi:hypothetical protein